jgi:hypothetical protein
MSVKDISIESLVSNRVNKRNCQTLDGEVSCNYKVQAAQFVFMATIFIVIEASVCHVTF